MQPEFVQNRLKFLPQFICFQFRHMGEPLAAELQLRAGIKAHMADTAKFRVPPRLLGVAESCLLSGNGRKLPDIDAHELPSPVRFIVLGRSSLRPGVKKPRFIG